MALQVIRVTADDWPLWRDLRRQALADAPDAFGSTLADWSGEGDREERWRERLDSVPFNVIVRDDLGNVGMASGTSPTADGSVEIISVWVHPRVRGKGVGDIAVTAVIEWAENEYPGADVILAVAKGNEPAFRLYGRHGFLAEGENPEDPSELVMRRRSR